MTIVGDFAEDDETMVFCQALRMVGHSLDTVCPGEKPGDSVKTSIHNFEGEQSYGKREYNFALSAVFWSVDASTYALLIPGGRTPEYQRLHGQVLDLDRRFVFRRETHRCHSIQILSSAGVVEGKHPRAIPKWGQRGEPSLLTAGLDPTLDGALVKASAWTATPVAGGALVPAPGDGTTGGI